MSAVKLTVVFRLQRLGVLEGSLIVRRLAGRTAGPVALPNSGLLAVVLRQAVVPVWKTSKLEWSACRTV